MNLDKKGLMSGRRIRRCSASARWAYVYYLLLINDYARIECDWTAIADEFVSWGAQGPGPEDIRKHFEEYSNNHLLMFYAAPGGRTWAQFDTRRTWLKHFKTAESERSPEPPAEVYIGWLKEQHGEDWSKYHCQKVSHEISPDLTKSSDISSNPDGFNKQLQSVNEKSQDLTIGVGVGVGGGGGKEPTPSSAPADKAEDQEPSRADKFGITPSEKLADLKEVFLYYLNKTGRNPKINEFSEKKRRCARVCYDVCLGKAKRGNTTQQHRAHAVQLMRLCIDNLVASDYHMGRGPQSDGTIYDDWEKHLFKNAGRLEFWWNRSERTKPGRAPVNNSTADAELERQGV